MTYDVVIIGGGPAGLSAALVLGRSRKRVLLADAGPRRNAAARRVHGFVTRDGTPPDEFRSVARAQLRPYASVDVRDAAVSAVEAATEGFLVTCGAEVVATRRILLCTGMVDDIPDVPGMHELWGTSVFQCPYCHAWEVRDRPFGYLARDADRLEWALLLRGWTDDVTVFTNGALAVGDAQRRSLEQAGVIVEERAIAGLRSGGGADGRDLTAVGLTDGDEIRCGAFFIHPPQRQTPVVDALGLALDAHGFVQVDAHAETSRPGIHAAGDLANGQQSAILAAAAGMRAAAAINHALTVASPRSAAARVG